MNTNKSYRELEVWKEARAVVKMTYLLTSTFPATEKYSLTQQINRSAISVVSNIAEGVGRKTKNDTLHFLYISRGSLYELETQLYLAFDLAFVQDKDLKLLFAQIELIKRLLAGFINYLAKK